MFGQVMILLEKSFMLGEKVGCDCTQTGLFIFGELLIYLKI
jgi:hypothetical protein